MFIKTLFKKIFALLMFSIGLELTINNYNSQFISILGFCLMAFGCYNLFINDRHTLVLTIRKLFIFKRSKSVANSTLDNELKWLDTKQFSYFHEFYIAHETSSFLMDTVIISKRNIFNIATKNYSGNIEIDGEGNWIQKNSDGNIGIESPLIQIKKQRILLEKIYPTTSNIVDVIVLTNQACILNGKNNCQVPIIRLDALLYYLDQHMKLQQNDEALYSDTLIRKYIIEKEDVTLFYKFKNTLMNFPTSFLNLLRNRKVIFLGITLITAVISFIIIQPFGGNKSSNTQGNMFEQTINEPTKNVQTTPTLILLNDCITTALNKKVKITAKSIEKSPDSTILNLTIENYYDKDIQLFGSDKIKLTDDSGNIYNLKPMKSTNLFDSIPTDSIGDVKMVFDGITHPYKKMTLSGEFWTLDLGALDTSFNIPILY